MNEPLSKSNNVESIESIESIQSTVQEDEQAPYIICCCTVPKRRVWEIITCFCMIISLIGELFLWSSFPVVMPQLIKEGYMEVGQAGKIIGCSHLLYFLGKLITGRMTDTFNARRVLLAVILIQSLSAIFLGLSNNIATIVIFYYTARVATSGEWPCLTKLIGNWYEYKQYGVYWGILAISATIFSVINYNLLALILKYLSWQWVYWIFGINQFFSFIIQFFILNNDPRDLGLKPPKEDIMTELHTMNGSTVTENKKEEGVDCSIPTTPKDDLNQELITMNEEINDNIIEGEVILNHPLDGQPLSQALLHFMKSPQFWFMVFGLMFMTCISSLENFIPLFLTRRFLLEADVASNLTSAYASGTFVAIVIGAVLYSKLTKRGIFFLNMTVMGILVLDLVVFTFVQQLSVEWSGLLLFLLGLGITIPWFFPMSIYSIECGGKNHSGMLSGILDGVSNLGTAGYSFLAGKLMEESIWDGFFLLTLIISVLGMILLGLFLYIDWRKRGVLHPDFSTTFSLLINCNQPSKEFARL